MKDIIYVFYHSWHLIDSLSLGSVVTETIHLINPTMYQISHKAPLCNFKCAHFCYKVVLCGMRLVYCGICISVFFFLAVIRQHSITWTSGDQDMAPLGHIELPRCGLVTRFSIIEFCQHLFKLWHVAWHHQAINWANANSFINEVLWDSLEGNFTWIELPWTPITEICKIRKQHIQNSANELIKTLRKYFCLGEYLARWFHKSIFLEGCYPLG